MIKRCFEIGEYPVGGRASSAHCLGVLAVKRSEVCFGAGAAAPAPWSLRNRTVPIQEKARCQLADEHVSKLGEDILARHALDAVGGLAAAATIVFEVVRHGTGDRVRTGIRRSETGCQPLLVRPPVPCCALPL